MATAIKLELGAAFKNYLLFDIQRFELSILFNITLLKTGT